ncbi:MAG: pyridoxamine 5'-phosphate oxidase [Holophagales bacterium]|nr:pyridoxamine 5'-phosphate oxidase [Holophagales bacterium]
MAEPLAPDDTRPHGPRADDPFEAFAEVMAEAESSGMEDPNAMILSTVGSAGQPSARAVLLKGFDRRGFVFYTNLESRKGLELAGNPKVSLCFFWRQLHRQVMILGTAEPVTDEEADAYFASRPRTSQLGAWASQQSRPMPSRAHLVAEVAKLEARYLGRAIPRPPHWSGYRVVPHAFEFWRAGLFRLHERHAYELEETGNWNRRRLYP